MNEAPRAATMIVPPTLTSDQAVTELTPVRQAALATPVLSPTEPNTDGWRSAEIPSANGFATARSLATLHGCLAGPGTLNGARIVQPIVLAQASTPQATGVDLVMEAELRWGCGFLCNSLDLYGTKPAKIQPFRLGVLRISRSRA